MSPASNGTARNAPPVSNLVELLQLRARDSHPEGGYTYLTDGESEAVFMSFAELDERARAIAATLQREGASGSRAVLLYPSGLEYVAAFFGCLYAGTVAVPAYPPRKNRSLDRIERMLSDARATVILSTEQILGEIEFRFAEHPDLQEVHRIATDRIDGAIGQTWREPEIQPDDLAFLQYTSGSTGHPKGVMVSHANLLANEALMESAFEMDRNSVVFGWLPLYHDMGLIGNVLQPLYVGARCVLISPVAFLEKPVRWLQGISTYRATTSGGPDFAYELCARKIEPDQCAGLDLSSWTVAYNGSEPIRAETLDRFVERFAPLGFQPEAFFPCYGLAEATLFVTGGPKSAAPLMRRVDGAALSRNRFLPAGEDCPDARTLVASGKTWADQRIRIVDPESLRPCGPGEVGEVWITGDSIARGYWDQDAITAEVFGGHVAGAENGAALRTGDLGFVQDGALFVTGRLKDVIIIRGRNHYPQDIEATVSEAHPALRAGFGAAFSVEVDGEERLAVVHEVERSALRTLNVQEVVAAIRRAVSDEHELQAHTIALLKTGGLPRTTSGKIQRRSCRDGLFDGTLAIVGRDDLRVGQASGQNGAVAPSLDRTTILSQPEGEWRGLILKHLQQLAARALKTAARSIDSEVPLAELGMDSINMVELKASIESDLGVPGYGEETLVGMSLSQLAGGLAVQLAVGESALEDGAAGEAQGEMDIFAKCDTDGGYFGKYRLAGDKYFTQPVLEGPIGPRMQFDGREVIVWSINDYLGLARHPRIWDVAREAVDEHGTWSPMGSRLLTGNTQAHMDLEARLAAYLDKEASIVFNYGYMGVMGTIASLVGEADTVIIDSLSHACIVDGAILASRAKRFKVFRHNDLESLEEQLRLANERRKGGVIVITEGVFGMTGDTAPLPGICDLKERYGARLFIDDAHGFGTMGPTGAGTAEHQGVHDRVDLYFGTFAKSFAAIGGVTAGPEKVVDYIRYNARTNVFAKSLPLVYVHAANAALDLIQGEPARRDHMWHIARRLQRGLLDAGFQLGDTSSPITPVYIPAGDEETATRAMRLLRSEYGIFVSAVTYPVVPRGVVLFRMTSTAAHSDEDVDRTLEAFSALKKQIDLAETGGDGRPSRGLQGVDADPVRLS